MPCTSCASCGRWSSVHSRPASSHSSSLRVHRSCPRGQPAECSSCEQPSPASRRKPLGSSTQPWSSTCAMSFQRTVSTVRCSCRRAAAAPGPGAGRLSRSRGAEPSRDEPREPEPQPRSASSPSSSSGMPRAAAAPRRARARHAPAAPSPGRPRPEPSTLMMASLIISRLYWDV